MAKNIKIIEVGGIKISEFLNPDWTSEKYVLNLLENGIKGKFSFSPDEFVEILQNLSKKGAAVDWFVEKIVMHFSLTVTVKGYKYGEIDDTDLATITNFVDGKRHGVAFGNMRNGLPRDRAVYSNGIFIGDKNSKYNFESHCGLDNIGSRTENIRNCLPGVKYLIYSISLTEMCDDIVHGLFEVCKITHSLINIDDGHELGSVESDRFYYCRPIINFKGELLIE
tara:strand:+ start:275 stop:946 length:672 start_codon:yes stop_codon:yes gene_type:complete